MKIIVIGCTHAGTAAVVNLKELHPESEITIYEKNDNISFLSCGIALNVGGVIKETKNLFYNSPENLSKMGVITNMKHEVLDIDFDNKVVKVKNLLSNEEFEDTYDKLVLTVGSWPIVPRFEGGDLENILLCKNHDHAIEIIEKSKEPIELELSNTLNLVTVSRLCFEKGFKRILLLANELKRQNIDFKWFVIGGNYYKDVEEKIKGMFKHLEENFVFFGFLDNPYNIIKQCDYLALLSDEETWGLVLTEAKILRVPCIVSDFEVAYEQIVDQKTGIIVSREETDYSDEIEIMLKKQKEFKENLSSFKYSNIQTVKRWNKLLSK